MGKSSRIPSDFTIGVNVIVGAEADAPDFEKFSDRTVPDGARVGYIGPDK
jgi:hypothetical protein